MVCIKSSSLLLLLLFWGAALIVELWMCQSLFHHSSTEGHFLFPVFLGFFWLLRLSNFHYSVFRFTDSSASSNTLLTPFSVLFIAVILFFNSLISFVSFSGFFSLLIYPFHSYVVFLALSTFKTDFFVCLFVFKVLA